MAPFGASEHGKHFNSNKAGYKTVKRIFDLVVSFTAIVLLSPLFLVIMIVLKRTGEKQVFFDQPRVGLNQKQFHVRKFVTMHLGSENISTITERHDSRVLPFGKFLRLTKINELPQLFNVFRGQMSIVGPRPLSPEGFDCYPEHIRSRIYIGVTPGLTGVGSVLFRNEEKIMHFIKKDKVSAYKQDIMPVKGAAEIWYGDNRSFWLDIKLIALTILSIVFPCNSFVARAFADTPFIDEYRQLPLQMNAQK